MDIRTNASRRGTILIIVVGLATILLTLATAFLMRMRSDAQDMRVVVATASCRSMLHAALNYIQETSILGWLPNNANAGGGSYPVPMGPLAQVSIEANNDARPCFGWTDVRDGTLGPKGPRDLSRGSTAALAPIPWPAWACTMTWHFTDPKRRNLFSPVDADLPAASTRRWPCPGSAVRAPMARAQRPPFATRLTLAYNPITPRDEAGTPVVYGGANFDTQWMVAHPYLQESYMPLAWVDKIFDPNTGATGALDPQPADPPSRDPYTGAAVDDDWNTFQRGQVEPGQHQDWNNHHPSGFNAGVPTGWVDERLAIVVGTENSVWFRIYREKLDDHDGDYSSSTDFGRTDIDGNGSAGQTLSLTVNGRSESWTEQLFYDRVALNESSSAIAAMDPAALTTTRNWNVFVIACGAGPTRGYRFWSLPDDSPLRALEPVTAMESGLWCSPSAPAAEQASAQSRFEQQLAQSTIQWFRVEWSGFTGGALDWSVYDLGSSDARQLTSMWSSLNYSELDNDASSGGSKPRYYDLNVRNINTNVQGGRFRFVQRLDHEPLLW